MSKSLSPIYDRIRRLEKDGYIKRYVAILDHRKIDRALMAFTHVKLKDHSKESLSMFQSEIILFDEVMECYHMSGEYDFILRVATENLSTYHDFLMNKLFKIMSVGSVQSTFVMKEAKSETAYVLKKPEPKVKKAAQ
jgi:Lrp/AsnC family leucine-responsive transcriptional regulator